MVQNRQLHCNYIDLHYASALFCYLKEMAIKYKDDAYLIFMDDKHRCKVGEPGYPVAAVEYGRQVLVAYNKSIQVLDHDFTKCGIIPSVTMICDIPESIEQSFYHGKVYVGLKNPVFQPSDPFHHMTELCKILIDQIDHKPFLFLYTDGGPDHRVTYLRVQIALITIFLALDLDILIALHTPPGHLWKNPVERIMLTLNLGLQCIGLMRNKMDEDFETIIKNCNSMDDIRNESKMYPSIIDELHTSLQPTIELMEDIIK